MSVAQNVKPSAEGADPKRAVAIVNQRANLIARESVGGRIEFRLPIFEPPQALPVGAGPQRAVARFHQYDECIIQERSAGNDIAGAATLKFAQARGQSRPQPSCVVFQEVE